VGVPDADLAMVTLLRTGCSTAVPAFGRPDDLRSGERTPGVFVRER
jgi:hypothetical protein